MHPLLLVLLLLLLLAGSTHWAAANVQLCNGVLLMGVLTGGAMITSYDYAANPTCLESLGEVRFNNYLV
jgi:hypothetical protein